MDHESTADPTIALFLDDEPAPFATYRPPARCVLDTATLADGPHRLRIVATDGRGVVGVSELPFIAQNGPGITVTGLRANERVRGTVTFAVNAFNGDEPFDATRAESQGPIPVWTWVFSLLIVAWAAWYGVRAWNPPPAFASADGPGAFGAASAPMRAEASNPAGSRLYATNCAACHGATGGGVPGVFPPLAGDPAVTARDARRQITAVLQGLKHTTIAGRSYAAEMPSFAHLSDDEIAAIVNHERTSWGNHALTVSADGVRHLR